LIDTGAFYMTAFLVPFLSLHSAAICALLVGRYNYVSVLLSGIDITTA